MIAFMIEFAAKIFLESSSKTNTYATQNFQAVAILTMQTLYYFKSQVIFAERLYNVWNKKEYIMIFSKSLLFCLTVLFTLQSEYRLFVWKWIGLFK